MWGASTFPTRNRLLDPFLVSQIKSCGFSNVSHLKNNIGGDSVFHEQSLFPRRPAATPVATDGDSAGEFRESSLTN